MVAKRSEVRSLSSLIVAALISAYLFNRCTLPVFGAETALNALEAALSPSLGSQSTRVSSSAAPVTNISSSTVIISDSSNTNDASPTISIHKMHNHMGTVPSLDPKLHKFDLFIDPICEQFSKLNNIQVNKFYSQLNRFSQHSNHGLASCFGENGFYFDPNNHQHLDNFCKSRANLDENFSRFIACATRVWLPSIDSEIDSALRERLEASNKLAKVESLPVSAGGGSSQLSSSEMSLISDLVAHIHREQADEIASELPIDKRAKLLGITPVPEIAPSLGKLLRSLPPGNAISLHSASLESEDSKSDGKQQKAPATKFAELLKQTSGTQEKDRSPSTIVIDSNSLQLQSTTVAPPIIQLGSSSISQFAPIDEKVKINKLSSPELQLAQATVATGSIAAEVHPNQIQAPTLNTAALAGATPRIEAAIDAGAASRIVGQTVGGAAIPDHSASLATSAAASNGVSAAAAVTAFQPQNNPNSIGPVGPAPPISSAAPPHVDLASSSAVAKQNNEFPVANIASATTGFALEPSTAVANSVTPGATEAGSGALAHTATPVPIAGPIGAAAATGFAASGPDTAKNTVTTGSSSSASVGDSANLPNGSELVPVAAKTTISSSAANTDGSQASARTTITADAHGTTTTAATSGTGSGVAFASAPGGPSAVATGAAMDPGSTAGAAVASSTQLGGNPIVGASAGAAAGTGASANASIGSGAAITSPSADPAPIGSPISTVANASGATSVAASSISEIGTAAASSSVGATQATVPNPSVTVAPNPAIQLATQIPPPPPRATSMIETKSTVLSSADAASTIVKVAQQAKEEQAKQAEADNLNQVSIHHQRLTRHFHDHLANENSNRKQSAALDLILGAASKSAPLEIPPQTTEHPFKSIVLIDLEEDTKRTTTAHPTERQKLSSKTKHEDKFITHEVIVIGPHVDGDDLLHDHDHEHEDSANLDAELEVKVSEHEHKHGTIKSSSTLVESSQLTKDEHVDHERMLLGLKAGDVIHLDEGGGVTSSKGGEH